MISFQDFDRLLTDLLRAHERMITAQFDAASCQTSHDRAKARGAEEHYNTVNTAFLRRVGLEGVTRGHPSEIPAEIEPEDSDEQIPKT